MRIAEISTPDYRQLHRETESNTHHPLLSEIELLIQQSESISKDQPLPQILPHSLRQSLTRLSQLAPFPGNSFKLTIWKLSFRLWNACVDLSNAASLQSSSSSAESIANQTATGYGSWLHGEAVGTGMLLAARLSERVCGLTRPERARIEALVAAAGLPTAPPRLDVARWLDLMGRDKKVDRGRLRFVLLERLGHAVVRADVGERDLAGVLEKH